MTDTDLAFGTNVPIFDFTDVPHALLMERLDELIALLASPTRRHGKPLAMYANKDHVEGVGALLAELRALTRALSTRVLLNVIDGSLETDAPTEAPSCPDVMDEEAFEDTPDMLLRVFVRDFKAARNEGMPAHKAPGYATGWWEGIDPTKI